jgi:transcriptional regulator with XRE-family HTH domain
MRVEKQVRKSAGLTQKELSIKTKISKKSIENYEKGRQNIPVDRFLNIMRVCGVQSFTVDFIAEKITVRQDGS